MPGDADRTLRVRISATGAVAVVVGILAVVVLRSVFTAAHRVLGWALAAVVLAVLIDPAVRLLGRHLPRAVALLLTLVVAASAVVALTYGVFNDLDSEVARLEAEAPDAVRDLEARDDTIGRLARDVRLGERVDTLLAELDDRVGSGGEALRTAVGSFPTYVVGAIFTLFVYLYGPRMVRGALGELSPRRRERLGPLLHEATRRSRGYVLVALAEAVILFGITWLAAQLLEVPAPVVLALVAAVLGVLPYVGVVLGALPVAVLGLAFAPSGAVLLYVAVAVALQLTEAVWLRPRVDRPTVHVGPAIPAVVALIGYGLYGIGGALYGAAVVVFLLAFADAAGTDEELPTPVDEWPEGAEAPAGASGADGAPA